MGVIKINNIIYGSNNSADIIYKNTTVEEKLNSMPVFDPSDNANIETNQYDYLTYGHIIDGLNSSDTSKVLSANQGKVLNEKIDNIERINNEAITVLDNKITENTNSIINIKGSISDINTNIATRQPMLKYVQIIAEVGGSTKITIPNSGWATISNRPSVNNFLFALLWTWSSNSGAFSISSDGAYIIGDPSTVITSIKINYYYYD